MTGFKGNQGVGGGGDNSNNVTPIQDKNSLLGSKPFIGINKQFGKSPGNQYNASPNTNNSHNMSEMKLQFGGFKNDIQEEISIDDHTVENSNQLIQSRP